MDTDVVFLAFAHSSTNPLESLAREDDEVYGMLFERYLKGHFVLHRDSHVTLSKINEYLERFQDRLVVFLYSGHANNDTFLLDKREVNAKGIAKKLGRMAKTGKLKLAILNGCSTAGQVRWLLDAGVPAVIATSAPIADDSATEFSISFFRCLSKLHMDISEAFENALDAAQSAAKNDLEVETRQRGFIVPGEKKDEEPIWGLFTSDGTKEPLKINPLTIKKRTIKKSGYIPNIALTTTLFDTLSNAGCEDILLLKEKKKIIPINKKQGGVVDVLPLPIGIQLKNLICRTDGQEGYDKINLPRLQQCARLFHVTVELLAFIMLAQLWELRLQNKISRLSSSLKKIIREYFHFSSEQHSRFDYLPFIRAIRQFLDDQLREEEGIPYFVEELDYLKGLVQGGQDFADACDYLGHLRHLAAPGRISDEGLPEMCAEAESHLCTFFSELGFLHRYDLTSIQNIDIRKYRHQLAEEAEFSHEAIKLMHSIGQEEKNHYVLPTYLDNRAVVLLKGKLTLSNEFLNEFTGRHLDFLNLSPFIIDVNAFDIDADISNLFSFQGYNAKYGYYEFKKTSKPDSLEDKMKIKDEEPYHIFFRQLEAFRQMILEE